MTDRLEGSTVSFLYQKVCTVPGKSTATYWDARAVGPEKLPPWFLNAEALENILLELAGADALPYCLCPGDKALNAFKWLVFGARQSPPLPVLPFQSEISCPSAQPWSHRSFLSAAQEHPQFVPKSLLASFSGTEGRKIAFNGNIEKALQHSVL